MITGEKQSRNSLKTLARPRMICQLTSDSRVPEDMNIPGFKLHPLKGKLKGYWAVSVSGNWRVTFCFEDDHATDVDYIDYH